VVEGDLPDRPDGRRIEAAEENQQGDGHLEGGEELTAEHLLHP
jgi:hypothetical protein